MIFQRVWSMPNKNTFQMKPVQSLILKYFNDQQLWIDPFARNQKLNCITNDLNPNCKTDHNLESLDFLKLFENESVDGVLFDPPYSPRQIKESYESIGLKASQKDTQSKFWSDRKNEIQRILKPNGLVISFGWNSNGLGINRNFQKLEIVLVAHGGQHNDTICLVEQKLNIQDQK